MKKYLKIILVPVLCLIVPYLLISLGTDILVETSEMIMFFLPVYVPFYGIFVSIMLVRNTGKFILPTLLFNLFWIGGTILLTKMIMDPLERSLADALIAMLLAGPLFYSVPISVISAAVCRYRMKKEEKKAMAEAKAE